MPPRPKDIRSSLSAPTARQSQLGWYARNAFESEARDDLLRQLRDVTKRLPQFTAREDRDEEWWESLGRDKGKDEPVPACGTPQYDRLRRKIEATLSQFTEPQGAETVFDINATYAAAAFGLDPVEEQVLRLTLRARHSGALRDFIFDCCLALDEIPRALAAVLGIQTQAVERCLRPNERLLQCGLLHYQPGRIRAVFNTDGTLYMPESMWIVMTNSFENERAWTQAIVGRPVEPKLCWDDFAHLGEKAETAWRLLDGAIRAGTPGVHIMLAGPPGTGKSEFAAALAAKAGIALYAIGETDGRSGEPSRGERLSALQASQAMLSGQSRVAILLDEAEDVLESRSSHGDQRESISKAYLNRMLETSKVPTLWTSNALSTMDLATVRRMSLIIRVPVPDVQGREKIWTRVLHDAQLDLGADAAGHLAKKWAAPAAAAAMAAQTTKLAGGADAELRTALDGIMSVLGRDEAFMDAPPEPKAAFDPELTACSQDLDVLCDLLARGGAPRNWSMCISGLPGTGKSAFARHLAGRLGMPVVQKRASDLLSMWVGGSEKAIAAAFAEARTAGSFLLIDEAEALLFDRSAATRSFEISQVNEMLTWMENHPLPLVCTTNLSERMDQAVPRRFTMKLRFEPLDSVRADRAFRRILNCEPPCGLPSGLTPGDFAVVKRKAALLGAEADGLRLVTWLREEAAVRGGEPIPMGFLRAS